MLGIVPVFRHVRLGQHDPACASRPLLPLTPLALPSSPLQLHVSLLLPHLQESAPEREAFLEAHTAHVRVTETSLRHLRVALRLQPDAGPPSQWPQGIMWEASFRCVFITMV